MDFSDLLTVNQKLNFSLSSDIEAKKHSCLVKKIKGALMAVVISNRDKGQLDLSVDGDIYLFHDHQDETWITHTRVAQNQSYPLVILDMKGEPAPITGPKEDLLPASMEGIESVENDHLASEPIAEPAVDLDAELPGIEPMGIEPADETPENELLAESLQGKDQEAWTTAPAKTDRGQADNALAEPIDMDDLIVLDDGLEDIPDIDTSELEAELEANIADSLEEKTEEPDSEETGPIYDNLDQIEKLEELEEVCADHSLEDMEIDRSDRWDIGEIGLAQPDMETDESRRSAESHLQPLAGIEEPASAKAEPFEDFFGFEFVVVDSETAEKLEGVISKYSSAQRLSFDAAEEIEDLDFIGSGGEDDNGLHETLKGLLTRVARVEKTIERFAGSAYNNQLSFGSAISEGRSDPIRSAICLEIDRTGIHAALDGPLPDGACVLLMVNRQWNPPLRFDAVAVLLESETGPSGISAGRLRFTAIHPDDARSVDDYLRRGSEYFGLLKHLTQS